jgi:hypothetical protein
MFGKIVVSKALAGLAVAGVMTGALATGVLAAPAASSSAAASPAAKQHRQAKDVFRGTVTAISDTQITVKDRVGKSETFLRTEKTKAFKGRDVASWSEIEVNSHVGVRYAERNGKLYALRVQIGRAHVAGRVESVTGNVITIKTRDGKDVRITVSAETKYFEGRKGARKPASLKDIHAGERLAAAGSWDKNGSFDAALILFTDKDAR